ncbi:MAG: hypothetical protein H0W72_17970, partial [Planctomycetes bacterium]|nr:hypothetical protein [Planctomycetota bacterium]
MPNQALQDFVHVEADQATIAEELRAALAWAPGDSEAHQQVVAFRGVVEFAERPRSARLAIFVDARYLCWVNGIAVGRGPCRFDPRAPAWDELDLRRALRSGANVIAVVAFGRLSSGQAMMHAPGFAARLTIADGTGSRALQPAGGWRCRRRLGHQVMADWGFLRDTIDARIEDDAWLQPEAACADWSDTVPVDGSSWGQLRPRPIPTLSDDAVALIAAPRDLADGSETVLDAGRMVHGYEVIEVEAAAGVTIEIEHAQRHDRATGAWSETYGSVNRWVTRAGRQGWRASGEFGCRALVIRVRGGAVRLLCAELVDHRYPYVEAAAFACDDAELDELWRRSLHTLRMCCADGYMDCALRERAEWMADAVVVAYPISRAVFAAPGAADGVPRSDHRLMTLMLRHIADSQLPDGRLKGHHPSDRMDIHGWIEDYACQWVHALRDVHERTGDLALVRELWPALVRQLAWFAQRITPRGLVRAREFVFFDNPLAYRECEGTTLNAMLAHALRDAAWIAGLLDATSEAIAYHGDAERLEAAIDAQLWDAAAGTYSSGWDGDQRLPASPVAAAVALEHGVVPPAKCASVRAWL